MAKCDFTVKANKVNLLMGPSYDQVTLNDLLLNSDQASKLATIIKTNPEADLEVTIKEP